MKRLLILLVCLLTILPLFHAGLFDVHDPTSIVRFFTLGETLHFGQFPAVWTNLLNEGYGYPLFLFYAPAFTYLGALLKIITPTYLLALKIAIGLIVALSGFGMYHLMRRWLSQAGAVVSSVAYMLLPYHASTLYVRGAYAEGVTWALLPWLLYVWSVSRFSKRWIAITSIVTSLFFLSHNVLPFAFIPLLLLWIVFHHHHPWRVIAITICIGIGLSAWFLAPVLFERNLIQVDSIATATHYSDHFLSPLQLWNSPWGYGGSAPTGQVDGMSFMLGKFQVLLTGLVLLWVTIKKKWNRQLFFFTTLALFYGWMTTYLSSPVWTLVKGLSILQFPWRLLAFAGFGIAALCGYLIEHLPKKLELISLLCLVSGLVFFNLKFFVPERYISYRDGDFLSQEKLDTTAANKIPEYLPLSMKSFPVTHKDDGLHRLPTEVFGETKGSEEPLNIQTAYMPQWQLMIDGTIHEIGATPDGGITSVTPLAHGNHRVNLVWRRSPIEKYSFAISLVAGLVVIGLLVL